MNESRRMLGRFVRFGSVVALGAWVLLSPAIAAQDEETEVHPAHIHTGTCAELGDVVAPLTDLTDPAAGVERTGPASAVPVKASETTVDMSLEEIIDGGHAINVHLSAEEIGTYIACGDIGGAVIERENGEGMEVVVGLAELNDSGHVGIAWLGDDGEGGMNVIVSLIEPGEMQ